MRRATQHDLEAWRAAYNRLSLVTALIFTSVGALVPMLILLALDDVTTVRVVVAVLLSLSALLAVHRRAHDKRIERKAFARLQGQ